MDRANFKSMKVELAERIRMARLMKSLSQQNMADELGITVASYSNIERGVTELTVVRLYAISEILGVAVQSLLKLEEEQPKGFIEEPIDNYTKNTINSQLTEILAQLKLQQLEIEKLQFEIDKLKK